MLGIDSRIVQAESRYSAAAVRLPRFRAITDFIRYHDDHRKEEKRVYG